MKKERKSEERERDRAREREREREKEKERDHTSQGIATSGPACRNVLAHSTPFSTFQ